MADPPKLPPFVFEFKPAVPPSWGEPGKPAQLKKIDFESDQALQQLKQWRAEFLNLRFDFNELPLEWAEQYYTSVFDQWIRVFEEPNYLDELFKSFWIGPFGEMYKQQWTKTYGEPYRRRSIQNLKCLKANTLKVLRLQREAAAICSDLITGA